MKKLVAIILTLFCIMNLINPVLADAETWYCDTCGTDRSSPFCPVCGSQKPSDISRDAEGSRQLWPVINLEGAAVNLRPLGDETMRHQAYFGPGKSYGQAGAYKPYKVISAAILFREGDYVLVDLDYETTGKRCVYFRSNMLLDAPDTKELDLKGYRAKTTMTMIPQQGPGNAYECVVQKEPSPYADWTVQELAGTFGGSVEIWEALQPRHNSVYLKAGSSVTVFFQTKGWIFAEFNCSLGLIRAWLPAAYVAAE